MGCACKNKNEKVMKAIPQFRPEETKIQGIKGYILTIWHNFLELLLKIVITIFAMIVVIPFAIVLIIKAILFNNVSDVKIPTSWMKALIKLEKKYG